MEAQMPIPLTPIPMMFVALLMGLLIPQLGLLAGEPQTPSTVNRSASRAGRRLRVGLERWLVPVSALFISIMLLLTAIATSGFSATHPGTDSVTYQLNANTGEATWQSGDQHLDDWTRQFFPTRTGQGPFQERAPTVALAAPTVTLQSDTMSGDVRMLRVQVISARHAEDAFVQVEAQGEIVAATLDGKPFELSVLPESARYQLELHVNEQGQLTRLSTQRNRGEHGELTPWSVQLNEYQEVDGMQIPTKSEVTWHLASGEFTWLRFQITEIEYNQSGKVTQF